MNSMTLETTKTQVVKTPVPKTPVLKESESASTPARRALFEIGAELETLENLLEAAGGDLSDPDIEAAFQHWFETQGELGQKLDRYVGLIFNLDALAEAREAQIKRMLELARADRNKANALKERLRQFFTMRGMTKYDTAHFHLFLASHGGKVPLLIEADVTDLPDRFRIARTVVEVDKEGLRAALEAGEMIEGARLGERGQSLRIR